MVKFKIADHTLEVEGVERSQVTAFLHSFTPFLIEEQNSLPLIEEQNSPPLLKVLCNTEVLPPSPLAKPLEEFSRNDFSYKIFKAQGGIICQMEQLQQDNGKGSATQQTATHLIFIEEGNHFAKCNVAVNSKKEAFYFSSLVMIAFTLATAGKNTLKIHASAIVKEGKGILFLGKSGTGKSTHAKLWVEHIAGAELLNDDEPIVRLTDDGRLFVYGTPWSGKTPCYKNKSAEVSAILSLKQHSENRLTQIFNTAAFVAIYQSAAILRSSEWHRTQLFNFITKVIELTPVYTLECLPNKQAALLSHTLLK